MHICESMASLSLTLESISMKLRQPMISFDIVAFRKTPCVETAKYVTSIFAVSVTPSFTNSLYHLSNIFARTRLVATRYVSEFSPVFKTARVSKIFEG